MLIGYCRNKHRLRLRVRVMTMQMLTQPLTRITLPLLHLLRPASSNTEPSMVALITASKVMLNIGTLT
jgi:hypothetical protein